MHARSARRVVPAEAGTQDHRPVFMLGGGRPRRLSTRFPPLPRGASAGVGRDAVRWVWSTNPRLYETAPARARLFPACSLQGPYDGKARIDAGKFWLAGTREERRRTAGPRDPPFGQTKPIFFNLSNGLPDPFFLPFWIVLPHSPCRWAQ